jgi:hypothetical protein
VCIGVAFTTMKQRITYLVSNPDEFHPDLLDVKAISLSLSKVKGAKEHRLTFGLNELPVEVCFSDHDPVPSNMRLYIGLISHSSAKRLNNGMSYTFDGRLTSLILQSHLSHHG